MFVFLFPQYDVQGDYLEPVCLGIRVEAECRSATSGNVSLSHRTAS